MLECLQKIFEAVADDFEVIVKHFFKNPREYILNEIKAIYKKSSKRKRRNTVRLFGEESAGRMGFLPSIGGEKGSHQETGLVQISRRWLDRTSQGRHSRTLGGDACQAA